MKAAVLKGIKELSLREVETPVCGPGDVLLKSAACGICRTDLKCFSHGQRDLNLPRILGHEISGTVADLAVVLPGRLRGKGYRWPPESLVAPAGTALRGQDNFMFFMTIFWGFTGTGDLRSLF